MPRAVLLAVLLALSVASAALGSERRVAGMVPAAADLGTGWSVVSAAGLDSAAQPLLASGTGATFAGPAGARVVVAVLVVETTPAAARRAWQLGNEAFDEARSGIDVDDGSEGEAESLALPRGCADARRGAGRDELFGPDFPVGLTLCAADPDAIVFVVTSGRVLGQTGHAASDAVVELMLGGAEGTPPPQGSGDASDRPAPEAAGRSGAPDRDALLATVG